MEQLVYERPREKLRNRGASFLTTVELLQIIIGSGTVAASGARLAKRISRVLVNEPLSLDALCRIKGIGAAKASQIIAALELGKRYLHSSGASLPSVNTAQLMQRMGEYRKLTLIVYFYDGNHEPIGDTIYPLKNLGALQLSQQVARSALGQSARSIILCLGFRKDTLQTTTYELDLIKHCKESLGLLSIQIPMVYRANAAQVERWSDL